MFCAKGLAAGPRKTVGEWTGEADFENDCTSLTAIFYPYKSIANGDAVSIISPRTLLFEL
jgi:hypothetical protein